MRDSGIDWVGKIPEEWKVYKIAQLFKQHKLKNEGLVEQNLLSLSYGKVIRRDFNSTEGLLPESFEGYNIIEEEDIVLRMTDLQNDQKSLRVGFNKERGIITSAYITLRSSSSVNSRYGYYYLHAFDLCKGFYGMGAGVRQGVNFNELKKLDFIHPSLEEQQKIAAFLDEKVAHIDNIIEDTKKSIENLKAYKQSLITETVTKGLNPNVEMKDSGIEWIGKIPSHWDTVKMKRLGNIRNGLTYKPIDIVDSEEGILVLRSGNIQNSQLSFQDNVHVKKEINPDLIVSKGDILICSRNGSRKLIGKNAIIEDDLKATFGAFMMLFRPNELPKYIYYILNSEVFNFYLGTFLTSTINQLTKGNFENMKIVFCPDTDEQGKIVAFLNDKVDKLNSMIQDKEKLLNEFESYKKSLIYECVTGKKEVE